MANWIILFYLLLIHSILALSDLVYLSFCARNIDLHGDRCSTVVKALCYKSEGRWFDPSWCHWNFSLTQNPSGRTMALGSTQPLTDMSTRSISWGKGGRCIRLTTLPPSCAVVTKSGNLNFLEPSGPFRSCNGTDLPK